MEASSLRMPSTCADSAARLGLRMLHPKAAWYRAFIRASHGAQVRANEVCVRGPARSDLAPRERHSGIEGGANLEPLVSESVSFR